jgi:signal transduction histidine kinase
VLEELSPQAHERGLWLRLAPVSRPVYALGDEGRIAQIFTNLVHNGIKFTEQGGVEVAIEPGPDMVRVEVRDTGIGIPEEEHARVFDRFYQVEGVVTRRAGGTGLGLSIVKILVQAHGGEVGVSSSKPEGAAVARGEKPVRASERSGDEVSERGTTFYFTLPAAPRGSELPAATQGPAGDPGRARETDLVPDAPGGVAAVSGWPPGAKERFGTPALPEAATDH